MRYTLLSAARKRFTLSGSHQRGDQVPKPVSQTLHWGRSRGGAGLDELGVLAAALGGDRRQRLERRTAGEELRLPVSAATMATVDLEKLRMSGAGKAIGVLTSGGDAQGDGARRHVYGWIRGFCLSSGPSASSAVPRPGTWRYEASRPPSGAPQLQVPVPRLHPQVASVRAAGHGSWHAPPSRQVLPAWGCVCAAGRPKALCCSFLGHTCQDLTEMFPAESHSSEV